jgi:hypothetical protein
MMTFKPLQIGMRVNLPFMTDFGRQGPCTVSDVFGESDDAFDSVEVTFPDGFRAECFRCELSIQRALKADQ